MVWALGLFGFGSLVLGLAPQLAINYVINPILPLLGLGAVQVSWFGLTPAAGSWWTMGGSGARNSFRGRWRVALRVCRHVAGARACGAGATRFSSEHPAEATWASFTGGESISGPGPVLPASDFSAILKNAWAPFYRAMDVDRVYLGAWNALQRISRALAGALEWV